MDDIIRAEDLRKEFSTLVAVDGISAPGEVHVASVTGEHVVRAVVDPFQ